MKLGSSNIGSVYLGANEVQKVYLGSNLVWENAVPLLLDTYTGAAVAYSLRKLRTAYTGNAICVRRVSDNTEQDIGFVNNELDIATLESFCSGTNGFVTTWYDQSGNARNSVQTTASKQPQIVSSGSVILYNGKPCVTFDDTKFQEFDLSSSFSPGTDLSFYFVNEINTTSSYGGLIGPSAPINNGFMYHATVQGFGFYNNAYQGVAGVLRVTPLLISMHFTSTEGIGYRNGILQTTKSVTIPSLTYQRTFYNLFGKTFGGIAQEMILYPTRDLTSRGGIETNINDFYSIY